MSAPKKMQLASDIEAAADAIANIDTPPDEAQHLRTVLRRLAKNILQPLDPVYAIPAADVGEETAYFLSAAPHMQADYQVLYRNVLSQLAADTLIAWASGEISEGRAAEILGLDRLSLREMRMAAIGRVHGPLNEQEIAHRLEQARAAAADYLTLRLASNTDLSAQERTTLSEYWSRLSEDAGFLALLDEWMVLRPPMAPPPY